MPVTHDAFDVQDSELARRIGFAILLRPEVDLRAPRHVVAQGVEGRVLVLHVQLIRGLDDNRDLHAPLGGSNHRLLDVRDGIDRIAHQQDPALGRVQNLQDGLLRVPEGDVLAPWPRTDTLAHRAYLP